MCCHILENFGPFQEQVTATLHHQFYGHTKILHVEQWSIIRLKHDNNDGGKNANNGTPSNDDDDDDDDINNQSSPWTTSKCSWHQNLLTIFHDDAIQFDVQTCR